MTPTSPSAFMLSAMLHGVVVALALLLNYAASRNHDEPPKVFELVAGEGEDFMAREAPALGNPGGAIKVAVTPQPVIDLPRPQPPAPVQTAPVEPAPVPVQPAPQPKQKTAPVKTPPPPPTLDKSLKQTIRDAKRNATRQIEKEQKAEEKKRKEAEARLTKEQYDREKQNKAKQVASAPKNASFKKIDVDGIAGGVAGGSSASKAGARGTALKSDNDDVLGAYRKFFMDELRRQFEPPPGLSDSLKVEIEVVNNADGSLARARVSKTSGVKEFDDAVLDAIRRVKLPARPDKKSETLGFTFTMRERGEG